MLFVFRNFNRWRLLAEHGHRAQSERHLIICADQIDYPYHKREGRFDVYTFPEAVLLSRRFGMECHDRLDEINDFAFFHHRRRKCPIPQRVSLATRLKRICPSLRQRQHCVISSKQVLSILMAWVTWAWKTRKKDLPKDSLLLNILPDCLTQTEAILLHSARKGY